MFNFILQWWYKFDLLLALNNIFFWEQEDENTQEILP